MILKVTNHGNSIKFNTGLESEGVISLNTDDGGVQDICIWDMYGVPFVLSASQFPSIADAIRQSVAPEPKDVKSMVDQDFVLDLIKGIRIDSKNIK